METSRTLEKFGNSDFKLQQSSLAFYVSMQTEEQTRSKLKMIEGALTEKR